MTQLTEQRSPEPASSSGTPAPRQPNTAGNQKADGSLSSCWRCCWLAGGFSVARRLTERGALAKETERLAIPTVGVTRPSTDPAADQLVLPAQLQAYVESAIYARTNGYLLRWTRDIGSHVKKGELLAEIDTPEVDQELSQAQAARQQTEAQLQLAKSTAERWTNLRKTDSVSQQEADQQASAYTPGPGQPGRGRRQRAPPAAA